MKQELPNDIDELKAIIKSLSERIEKLEAENAELRSRLSLRGCTVTQVLNFYSQTASAINAVFLQSRCSINRLEAT